MVAIRPDIGEALVKVAREINDFRSLDSTLSTIVQTAARSLPGIDHVGISIAGATGAWRPKAGTGPFVWGLDELQDTLRRGPGRPRDPQRADHHGGAREPRVRAGRGFMTAAVEQGLRSQISLRLYTEKETLGALNMYSTSADTIDPDVLHMAELFAAHASIALGRARRDEQLNAALLTRKVIGQAIGILMERHGLDEDGAFAYLTQVSSHTNVKLRGVAKEIVALRNDLSKLAG